MPLPTTTKGITTAPEENQFMFYGPPGIGKSAAAATFPDVCFISTTRGLGHLDVAEAPVEDWDGFLELCNDIAKGGHGYRCFCIDLLRDLYDYCIDYVSAETLGGKHPSDFEWGKGWGAVGKEFRRALGKLMQLTYKKKGKELFYGFIYIAHDDTREVRTRHFKIDKIIPKLTKSTFNWLFGILDVLAFMEMEQYRDKETESIRERRVLHLCPSTVYEAKRWIKELPDSLVFQDEDVYDLITGHMPKPRRRKK